MVVTDGRMFLVVQWFGGSKKAFINEHSSYLISLLLMSKRKETLCVRIVQFDSGKGQLIENFFDWNHDRNEK